jgi:Tfp pilus assembly protein PilN
MSAISAEIKNGYLVSLEPVDLPEGTKLTVLADLNPGDELCGMTEEQQGSSTEAIERWLAAFQAIEPLEMTTAEEARWQADRRAQREYELSTSDERLDRLRSAME